VHIDEINLWNILIPYRKLLITGMYSRL